MALPSVGLKVVSIVDGGVSNTVLTFFALRELWVALHSM